jgi:predicted nucleotide-binding protein (sugar kinase/HSP70/actin superfamily)
MRKRAKRRSEYIKEHHIHGIVLAGRPYHIDPEINHGIPEMINSYGIAVLSEDSISHLANPERPLIVLDQWMYHSRLYAAASYVKTRDDLDMIQLNSFGCGLDAVTTDQVNDILSGSDKIYTCLKIDEVNNLGSARIRVRSLIAAIRIRERSKSERVIHSSAIDRVPYTEEMQSKYIRSSARRCPRSISTSSRRPCAPAATTLSFWKAKTGRPSTTGCAM